MEGSQGALWRSEEVCGRSCHILRSLIRAPLLKHFQRAVPRSDLCTGVAVMSQAAGEVSPSPPSLIYPIISIHREREVVGVRPTATGTSPCLITDTHTHTQRGPLMPTLNLMLCLSLSLSLSLVTMATARMAEKGEMRRRGCGGGVAMATALA